MRLPRYTAAQSQRGIVSELQSVRNQAITPAEAARETMAKYGAVAAVAQAAGEIAGDVSVIQQEAQAAQDDIVFEIGENNLTIAMKGLENDPNLKKPVQDDGTPTSEYYQREADAILKTYKDSANNISNPDARRRAEQLMRNRELNIRADMAGDIGVIETRVAYDKLYTGFTSALRSGDIEGAQRLIGIGKERLLLDPETAERWIDSVEKQDVKINAFDMIADVDEGYSVSQEEGDRRLSELIKDTSIDPQVKNMAVDGSEEKRVEWAKARDNETKAQEVNAIISFGDDTLKADAGMMSFEQIDAGYQAGKYGNPASVGAANRRNQLYGAVTSAIGRQETQIDIRRTYENGQFMVDDKKHRDALSGYEDEVTAGMDGSERINTIGDISRTLGTVSTRTSSLLDLSGKSEAALAKNINLYREITGNEHVQPTLHISANAEAVLENASLLISAGVGATEAASIAWANQNISEIQKTERTETWRNTAVSQAITDFEDLLGSDYYEEPGFGNVDDPPAEMQVEYGAVFRRVFMQTGDEETAKSVANRAIKSVWVMSNFNSADAAEYAIVRNGLPGDVSGIRKGVIREISAEKFSIQQPDGSYKTTDITPEKVTFIRAENGSFGVLHDGRPLARITDNGIQIATFNLDETKLAEYKEKTAKKETIEKRLTDITHEIKRMELLTDVNIHRDITTSFTITSRKQRMKALGNEKARLEKELPNLGVRF